MQQAVNPQRAVGRGEVEIGHAASQQRVSLAELVLNVQTRLLCGNVFANVAELVEVGKDFSQGLSADIWAEGRHAPSCAKHAAAT